MKINEMFKSRRFVAFCVGVVLFTVMVFTTDYTPVEVAGGITIITGIYIGADTLRKSVKEIG